MQYGSYTIVVDVICSCAIATNLLLLYVFICCPLRTLVTYKYFFMLTVIQDLISATCFLLLAPKAISYDFTFMFISTGIGCKWSIGPSILMLYSITFVSSIILVTNNFVYKYIQLCTPYFLRIYSSPKWLGIIIAMNAATILNWIAMSTFCGWPSKEFVDFVSEYGINILNFNLRDATFMGVSMKYGLTPVTLALLIEALLLVLVLGAIGLVCAMNIHICLKQNSMSTRTKRMHRQMLTLLLLQTGCPLLLLHGPLYTMYALLFTGVTSAELLNYVIGILMALFPFICPIITLTFMKDYRNFILIMLSLKKRQRTDTSTVILKKGIDNGKPVFIVPRTLTRISL